MLSNKMPKPSLKINVSQIEEDASNVSVYLTAEFLESAFEPGEIEEMASTSVEEANEFKLDEPVKDCEQQERSWAEEEALAYVAGYKDDTSLLAQFFYADEALNMVAAELDSFDGRKDPERCTSLVNHLRQCQDKVLTICSNIMDEIIPEDRANRDFRVKFPDDVMQENLAGQLWFGAECLAAGSSIMNRENESSEMRPLAKALTKALENVRNFLREQCLRGPLVHSGDMFCERLQEALKIFDRLFAEFELCYVSAMVPVKTPREYEVQQFVVVLFSETLQRALQMKLLNQEMVDDYDPALMFTIPRLAIVSGLLIFPDGPLCLDKPSGDMSEMFRPFRTLLFKIRELLWTLNKKELFGLEKLLCSSEEPNDYRTSDSNNPRIPLDTADDTTYPSVPDLDDFVTRFYIDYPNCKQFVTDFYTRTAVPSSCVEGDEVSESDEDTEWVGETSECDSVATEVFRVLDSETGSTRTVIRVSGDSWSNGSITPLDAPDSLLGVISANNFNTCQVSSSLSATINDIVSEPLERHEKTINDPCCENNLINTDATELVSNNIDIPITSSGFLIANQVGHEAMMATVDGVPPRSPIVSPSGAQSLPDGDSGEAMSVATATLSTLLLRSSKMSPGVYHREPSIGEDDSNTQSPLDSGVGTVLSCSETGSLSDRSPDAESCEVRETTHQGKHKYVDKVLPNILIRTEGEEWVGMMSEEGQYTVCNDNLNNVRTSDLNYSENWESLMTQHSEEPSSSESKLSLPSSSSSFKSLVAKETRKLDVSPSYDHHSQHPPIMVVSKRLGRSLEAPAASSYSSTCSSCQSSISGNSDSCSMSSDTSSFNSECQDDEEIALAMQAAEIANRNEARSKFRSSDDLIHRLFVCIAGVADQLQTNFAGDLRNILKSVFLINASCSAPSPSTTPLPRELERSPSPSDNDPARAVENAEEALSVGWESPQSSSEIESPPPWIPDDMAPRCMSCETVFTVVRRRHHCRNCGKVFCARCSSNSVPLPRYGHVKPVRVCNRCFLYQVTPFMLEELATRS
uniref:Lateral signaling target protein 2 homolog n=1 Tax=Timema bartmani TaxID=61472 RepID=A0A7R9EYD1_9NEOP|nr:unnamed protein product [Timema bartmani]